MTAEPFDPKVGGVDPSGLVRPEFEALGAVSVFPHVRSYLDVPYAWPPGYRPLTLDLHLPEDDRPGPRPVVVYAHGGAFLIGTRRMGPWRFLLDAGIAVASVSYRFSGEARFPAVLHDVADAVRWTRRHAEDYGLDPTRIAGFGTSAGAYLVAATALIDDVDLVGPPGPTEADHHLVAVVDHVGFCDPVHVDTDALPDPVELMSDPTSFLARFLGFPPQSDPDRADAANLLRRITPAAPPFLIVHGDDDHRVGIGQSRRLQRGLTEAGVRAELMVLHGADHASPRFDDPDVHETTLRFLRTVNMA